MSKSFTKTKKNGKDSRKFFIREVKYKETLKIFQKMIIPLIGLVLITLILNNLLLISLPHYSKNLVLRSA